MSSSDDADNPRPESRPLRLTAEEILAELHAGRRDRDEAIEAAAFRRSQPVEPSSPADADSPPGTA